MFYLDNEDVVACGAGEMAFVLPIVEDVLRLHADQETILPSKVILRWGDAASESSRGRFNAMPGYVGGAFDTAGIKWMASFPSNVASGLPRGTGLMILNDASTGLPLGVVDVTLISAMRTGAVAGIAAGRLAASDASTLGLIGAGVISRTSLLAIASQVSGLDRVLVFDPATDRATEFAHEMGGETGLLVEAADAVDDAAQAAIVVTATTSQEPIIQPGWLSPGATYIQLGGNECHPDVIRASSKTYVDDWNEVVHRGIFTVAHMHALGEFSRDDVTAELGELLLGTKPGRAEDNEQIVVAPIGMGIYDIAIGKRLLERALERGVGRELPFLSTAKAL